MHYSLHLLFCCVIQKQEEMSELRSELQEMYQLHESTINELQSLKAEFKDQIEEKV